MSAHPTLVDGNRSKILDVRVSYPVQPGKPPIILLSHGAYGDKDGYEPLVNQWASHGYVVIQPTHDDSMKFFAKERGRHARANRSSTDERKVDLQEAFEDFKKRSFKAWRERPRDFSFILDSLREIERQLPALEGFSEQSNIGMFGHSYGAHTAMILGGTVIGGSTEFHDKRIKNFIVASAQGVESGLDGVSAMDENSWENFNSPMMNITGTEDPGRNGEPHTWRFSSFVLSPPNDKYLMVIDGGHHGFGGIAGRRFEGSGPDNEEHVRWVKAACLAFWDAYLKESEEALDYLQSDTLTSTSGGAVSLARK